MCTVKPKEYQLNELVQFIKTELDVANKGYLLESLWKYMLYSEALAAVRDKVTADSGLLPGTFGRNFGELVDSNELGLANSFTSRLVHTVRSICSIPPGSPDVKVRVSEILHVREIGRMSSAICDYVENRRLEHFSILVDGLDANWRLGDNQELMSDILLALIGAARDIWRDCNKTIESGQAYWTGTTVAIFIRSDVFAATLERARDPDKLQFESLFWPSTDSLLAVVAKRIAAGSASSNGLFNWADMLEPGFAVEDMRTILNNNVLPRPRDYIYYFQRVFYYARLRGTNYLTKRDFQSGLDEYSQWALLSLSGESQPYIPNMLDLLLEFDRKKEVLTLAEVEGALGKAGVDAKDLKKALNFLLEINFLGYGIDAHNYRFPSSPTEETITKRRFLRHTEGNWSAGRYKVHNAFHPVLNIQK